MIQLLSLNCFILFLIQYSIVQCFQPYVNNQAQSLIDVDIKWQQVNKDIIYLKEVDIHAYYIINDDEERTSYPAIQASQNGENLGSAIKLTEGNLQYQPHGLKLCKTGDDSFGLFFSIPNEVKMTAVNQDGETVEIYEHNQQHIKFVHFQRFTQKMKYIQSEIITVAQHTDLSYFKPSCAYFPETNQVQFIYGSNLNQQIYTNAVFLNEDKQYELKHDLAGFVIIEDLTQHIDNYVMAYSSSQDGYLIAYNLRPENIFDDPSIVAKLRLESFKDYDIQEFIEFVPSTDHKWIFYQKIEVNTPQQKVIISWQEDLSIRYQIYDFQLNKICDEEIDDSQNSSITSWGDLGLISFRNSTGYYIQEINLQTCELYIDKLQVLYDLWDDGTIDNQPQDIRIQKGQEVTLQVIFNDNKSMEVQQLSYVLSRCPDGCGDCDDTNSCNSCLPSTRNYPACDECNDGYVEKNNVCSSCQELYGSSCLQCNEFDCTCESTNGDDCNACIGTFRDVNNNCACQTGFQEDIVTKRCEFIPCQKGYYEYQFQCLECYWIKGSEYCYRGECPKLYIANEDTYECVNESSSSLLLLIIIIALSILLIVVLIITYVMYKKNKDKDSNKSQVSALSQKEIDIMRKATIGNDASEIGPSKTNNNRSSLLMEQSLNTSELISPMKSQRKNSEQQQSPVKGRKSTRSRTRLSRNSRNANTFVIPE